MKATVQSLLTLVALAAMPVVLHAQEAPKPPTSGGGNSERPDGDRRQFNMEDFRKRMSEQMKTSLKVNDEEWSVLQPLIEKVTEKQRDASGRSFGFGDRRSSSGGSSSSGGDSSRSERPGSAERDALRTTLQNEGASSEEIKAKLNALREIRKKSTAELATAREELKKVVTVRQEAVLVSMGILE
jgi:Spy/CpxP family protein refolding chaperone